MRPGIMLWLLALAGAFSLPLCAVAQEAGPTDVSYVNLSRINDAFSRFSKTHHNLSCFRARVVDEGRGVRVEIYPSNNSQGDEKKVVLNTSSCGLGAVFTYDSSGRLARTVYTR